MPAARSVTKGVVDTTHMGVSLVKKASIRLRNRLTTAMPLLTRSAKREAALAAEIKALADGLAADKNNNGVPDIYEFSHVAEFNKPEHWSHNRSPMIPSVPNEAGTTHRAPKVRVHIACARFKSESDSFIPYKWYPSFSSS